MLEETSDECVAVEFVREASDKGLERVEECVGNGRGVVAIGEKWQPGSLVCWRLRGICIIQLCIGAN